MTPYTAAATSLPESLQVHKKTDKTKLEYTIVYIHYNTTKSWIYNVLKT